MGGMFGLAGRTYGSCVKRHPVRSAFYYNEVSHYGCNIYDAEQRLGLDIEHGRPPFDGSGVEEWMRPAVLGATSVILPRVLPLRYPQVCGVPYTPDLCETMKESKRRLKVLRKTQ